MPTVRHQARSETPKESAAQTRARILRAARALFERKGIDALSMRTIAARAGMPTMTLYGYFPNKTAIVRALWSLAFDPLFEEMRAIEASVRDPKQRLIKVAQTYVNYWVRFEDRYRIVYLVEDRREDIHDGWFVEQPAIVAFRDRMGSLVAAARGTPDRDCTHEAEALICSLTGIAHMLVTVSEYPWLSADRYVEQVIAGFAA